jgi:hypothetical protein
VLKWSYVLAYFIFGPEGKKKVDQEANKAHKMLFEDHQEQVGDSSLPRAWTSFVMTLTFSS